MADHPVRSIETYNHNRRIGVLVEFESAIEFTARVPEVAPFMKDVAIHVAALAPNGVKSLGYTHFLSRVRPTTVIVLLKVQCNLPRKPNHEN